MALTDPDAMAMNWYSVTQCRIADPTSASMRSSIQAYLESAAGGADFHHHRSNDVIAADQSSTAAVDTAAADRRWQVSQWRRSPEPPQTRLVYRRPPPKIDFSCSGWRFLVTFGVNDWLQSFMHPYTVFADVVRVRPVYKSAVATFQLIRADVLACQRRRCRSAAGAAS